MKNIENKPLREMEVAKSNIFISSKHSKSIRALKLLNICMAKIDPFSPVPPTGARVKLSMQEIREALGLKGNSIYSQMKAIVQNIRDNNTYYFEDDTNNRAGFFVLVDYCDYQRGEGFVINFGSAATPFLYEIQKQVGGYTTYQLANTLDLESAYSYNLYELFRQNLYKIDKKHEYITVTYNFNELKFIIGLLNFDSESSKKAKELYDKGEKDYDKIVEAIEGDVPYSTFGSFKQRVLDKAQKELREHTDIRFEYDTIKSGRKVSKITFRIYKNNPTNNNIKANIEKLKNVLNNNPTSIEKQDAIIEYTQELIVEQRIKISEARKIAEAANYEVPLINEAYKLSRESTTKIDNIVGWLITCIRENWSGAGEIIEDTLEKADEDSEYEVFDFDKIVPRRE